MSTPLATPSYTPSPPPSRLLPELGKNGLPALLARRWGKPVTPTPQSLSPNNDYSDLAPLLSILIAAKLANVNGRNGSSDSGAAVLSGRACARVLYQQTQSVELPLVLVERAREALRALGPLVAEAEGASALPMHREPLDTSPLDGDADGGTETGLDELLSEEVRGYVVPHRFAKWLRDPEKLGGIEGFQW